MATYCTLEIVPVEVNDTKTKLKIFRSKIQKDFGRFFVNIFSKPRPEKEDLVFDGTDLVVVCKVGDGLVKLDKYGEPNGVVCLDHIKTEVGESLVSATLDDGDDETLPFPSDSRYEKYREMLRFGVPRNAIDIEMRIKGLDPNMLA